MGGTFDILHDGHRTLLEIAFRHGDFVFVGLSSDRLAAHGRERKVHSYRARKRQLVRFIESEILHTADVRDKTCEQRFSVVSIDNLYGRTLVMPELEAIVVSEDTAHAVEKINTQRREKNLESIEGIVVAMVKAVDGRPISATRIAHGEVRPDGSPNTIFPEKGFEDRKRIMDLYPAGGLELLFHVCCAPCLSVPLQYLEKNGHVPGKAAGAALFLPDGGEVLYRDGGVEEKEIRVSPMGYFFNPNIHPLEEHLERRDAVSRTGFPVVFSQAYDQREWLANALDAEENDGSRCGFCYRQRLDGTARFAVENGFDAFSTTLLSSPYQDHELVKEMGREMAREHGIPFLYFDLRDNYDSYRGFCARRDIYVQKYCGCIFSEKERYEKRLGGLPGYPKK